MCRGARGKGQGILRAHSLFSLSVTLWGVQSRGGGIRKDIKAFLTFLGCSQSSLLSLDVERGSVRNKETATLSALLRLASVLILDYPADYSRIMERRERCVKDVCVGIKRSPYTCHSSSCLFGRRVYLYCTMRTRCRPSKLPAQVNTRSTLVRSF